MGFQYHHTYKFVALNILQRREAHHQAKSCTTWTSFPDVSAKLNKPREKPELITAVASHLQQEGSLSTLSPEQKDDMDILHKLEMLGATIPGSDAAKKKIRAEIRAYVGLFSVPPIFFATNPSPAHSPLFQVTFGDTKVDFSSQDPQTVESSLRAQHLAEDAVAAIDLFDFSIQAMFEFLFGWDYSHCCTSPEGGILGKIRAFYRVSEYTEHGCLLGQNSAQNYGH